jgi:hypothetical protein
MNEWMNIPEILTFAGNNKMRGFRLPPQSVTKLPYFWIVIKRVVVISYRRFGTRFPKTSLRNNPAECSFQKQNCSNHILLPHTHITQTLLLHIDTVQSLLDVCLFIQQRTAASRLIVRSGLDVPTFVTRRLHACHHARAPSGGKWKCGREMSGNFA